MENFIIVSLFSLLFFGTCVMSKMQCMGVRGRAKCGEGHANIDSAPIFIKLVDRDTARVDDDMDETYASRISGAFYLRGCADDPFGTEIDPELRIYHKCKGRDKMVTLVMPKEKIGQEHNISNIINLQGNFQQEKDKTYPVPKCLLPMLLEYNLCFFIVMIPFSKSQHRPALADIVYMRRTVTAKSATVFDSQMDRQDCLWIKGRVLCERAAGGKHNGEPAIVYLIDDKQRRLDEAYSSKEGYFSVYGCSSTSFSDSNIWLDIVHNCKSELTTTRQRFLLPYTNQQELSISDPIDLKAHYSDESETPAVDYKKPCSTF